MKSAAALKADIESIVGSRFAASLTFRERPAVESAPSGVPEVDALSGGLPRGAITEIVGPASSGRTSLALSMLAAATAREEVCAVVDVHDSFDPASAAGAGIDLGRLLWVRCGGRPDHALKAADLLIQGGGFGLVALDFGDVVPRVTRRIPLTSWYRFRRAVENTPTALIVLDREPTAKACASLILEMRQERALWSGEPGCSCLLRGMRLDTAIRKPVRSACAHFEARAL
jgi:recombination protein RecA